MTISTQATDSIVDKYNNISKYFYPRGALLYLNPCYIGKTCTDGGKYGESKIWET